MRDELTAAQDELVAATAAREERERIAAEKKRADDELRAQPLKVGDRVRYRGRDICGTIVRLWSDSVDVAFDSASGDCWEAIDELERLIPGDRGYAIPAVKRAEVEKRLAEYRVLLQRQQRPMVGDRVTDDIHHHWLDSEDPPNGAGTVVFASDFEPDGYDDGFTIQFDNGKLGMNTMACQLRRLLPGDAEFERSQEVVAAWRARELKQVDVEAGVKSAETTAGACEEHSVPDDTPPD
jgi:hypothetical protein